MTSFLIDDEKLKEFHNREINRILNAPVNQPLSEELVKKFSKATLLPSAEIELLPVQCEAIKAYLLNGGAFCYIKVGGGKTLISFACAVSGYRKGNRKIILLIPPKLTQQTVEKKIPWLRRQMPINLPIHVIAGKNRANRLKLSKQNSGLFIMAWSQLSNQDTDEIISNIAPDMIIADEAHNLSNRKSSRYKRINRWMVENPDTEFIPLSGTMGKKGIMDYYHLVRWALKDKAPLPDTEREAGNWAGIIDTTFSEYTPSKLLDPFITWAKDQGEHYDRDIAGYRKSFNLRMKTTSGVVFDEGNGKYSDASVLFENIPVEVPDDYEGMPKLQDLMDQLHDMDTSPDGDIIDYAIHKFKHDYELTAGFYNSLRWPSVNKIMERKQLSESDAQDVLERSQDYHRASQDYHREVRHWLENYSCEGLDTPLLLGNSMYHHGPDEVGVQLYDAWNVRKKMDFEGRIDRDSKPIRVCDYKIMALLKWIQNLPKKRGGVIVWYKNTEVGKWAFEVLKGAGIDVVLCDAGDRGSRAMNNSEYHRSKVMVCSITAYREGIDAQPVEYQYYLQAPREAHFWEQACARNNRTGALYDEFLYTTNFTSDFDHRMFSAVLADSLFQSQTGSPHILIYGNYTPTPKLVHAAALKEMGIIQNETKYEKLSQDLHKIFN